MFLPPLTESSWAPGSEPIQNGDPWTRRMDGGAGGRQGQAVTVLLVLGRVSVPIVGRAGVGPWEDREGTWPPSAHGLCSQKYLDLKGSPYS